MQWRDNGGSLSGARPFRLSSRYALEAIDLGDGRKLVRAEPDMAEVEARGINRFEPRCIIVDSREPARPNE